MQPEIISGKEIAENLKTAADELKEEQGLIKLNVNFWMQEFSNACLFPERQYKGDYHYVWHCTGDIHIGFERVGPAEGARPFRFVYNGYNKLDTVIETRFFVEQLGEYRLLLKALVDPTLIPLCVGFHWAEEIVSLILQRSAALMRSQEKQS